MAQTQFEIIERLYEFPSTENSLYHKELNLVSWYGKEAKYDIRNWSEDHLKPGRGVSLTEEEFRKLIEVAEEILY